MRKAELIKKNQELYSWNWFYTNSNEMLMITRYPILKKEKFNNDGTKRYTLVSPYIEYSKRFKEDREKAKQCQLQIDKNQQELNVLFQEK